MKPNFKVGDMIYATKNAEWGLEPMEVVKIFSCGTLLCRHSLSYCISFNPADCVLINPRRKAAINKLKKMIAAVAKEKKKLFKE